MIENFYEGAIVKRGKSYGYVYMIGASDVKVFWDYSLGEWEELSTLEVLDMEDYDNQRTVERVFNSKHKFGGYGSRHYIEWLSYYNGLEPYAKVVNVHGLEVLEKHHAHLANGVIIENINRPFKRRSRCECKLDTVELYSTPLHGDRLERKIYYLYDKNTSKLYALPLSTKEEKIKSFKKNLQLIKKVSKGDSKEKDLIQFLYGRTDIDFSNHYPTAKQIKFICDLLKKIKTYDLKDELKYVSYSQLNEEKLPATLPAFKEISENWEVRHLISLLQYIYGELDYGSEGFKVDKKNFHKAMKELNQYFDIGIIKGYRYSPRINMTKLPIIEEISDLSVRQLWDELKKCDDMLKLLNSLDERFDTVKDLEVKKYQANEIRGMIRQLISEKSSSTN